MAKKAKKESLDPTLPIFQVKISLQHINPLIWRRVLTDDCSLDELHEIIQASMGWEDMHMYAFVINDEEYANPERGSDAEYDARFVRLSEILEQGSTRFRYDYDFGDDWEHTIQIEKTLPAEAGVRYPRCIAGARACPPEDCGGPYGYADMLATIEDPEDEEHEDMLEWVGGEFDPEKFDLEEANDELQWLRRWLGNRRGTYAPKATFTKGKLVRVKPGAVHELYPDIPLGGWVGKIKRILWLSPLGYEVRWTQPTLDQAHPVYLKRAQRDGIQPNVYWLDEDQVEAVADETPVAMEQPKDIATRPLSEDGPEDRIRTVFGLTADDPLPPNDEQYQQKFLEYLKGHVSFPFKATDYWDQSKGGTMTVLGFADPVVDRKDGIICEFQKGNQEVQFPLAHLEVPEDDPNFLYVEDYTYWMWEVLDDEEDFEDEELGDEDDEEDEEPETLQYPIGTVALYGPNDKITTKIVAGVIKREGAEPILKRWMASDAMKSPKVKREMEQFFRNHGVKMVGMADENIGCPHEEGEDFPEGGDCPFCPWWKGKQGSGRRE